VTNDSHVFNTSSNKTNRWLVDTGATNYITYDKSRFLTYTKMPGLHTIGTINSDTRPEGSDVTGSLHNAVNSDS
jgi:hypothetical protein